MTLDELRAQKREAILAIAAHHGVTTVRVFGSFLRGDAGPLRDLDLLIERSPRRTPFFPGGLIADLERELGRKVDVTSPSALHPSLRDDILREAVPL
jgi:predicted nucleotidyltransferase